MESSTSGRDASAVADTIEAANGGSGIDANVAGAVDIQTCGKPGLHSLPEARLFSHIQGQAQAPAIASSLLGTTIQPDTLAVDSPDHGDDLVRYDGAPSGASVANIAREAGVDRLKIPLAPATATTQDDKDLVPSSSRLAKSSFIAEVASDAASVGTTGFAPMDTSNAPSTGSDYKPKRSLASATGPTQDGSTTVTPSGIEALTADYTVEKPGF